MSKLVVVEVLSRAYNTIQAKQVSELSQRMNRLFTQMTANVSERRLTTRHNATKQPSR